MNAVTWTSNVNRFQDRVAFAQRLTAMRPGDQTVQQQLADLDAADLETLKGAEGSAGYARGEGVVIAIGNVALNMRDTLTHYDQVYSGRAPRMPDGSSGNMTALNVDFVVDNQAKIADGNVENIAYYAEYVQKSFEAYQRVDPGYGFTGYAGTERVTHDVNQYIDWMYERAGIERPKSFDEVSGAFTPSVDAKPADLGVYLDAVAAAAEQGAAMDAAKAKRPQGGDTKFAVHIAPPSQGQGNLQGKLDALGAEMKQLAYMDASDTASAVMAMKKIGEIIDQIGKMGISGGRAGDGSDLSLKQSARPVPIASSGRSASLRLPSR